MLARFCNLSGTVHRSEWMSKLIVRVPQIGNFDLEGCAMTSHDVVIRNTANEEFEVIDAETHEHLGGPYHSFALAIAAAGAQTSGNVFQQVLDNRGRAMGDPLPIRPHPLQPAPADRHTPS